MSEPDDEFAHDCNDLYVDEIELDVEPTIDTDPKELAEADLASRFYTKMLRGAGDVVLSGPVIGGWGPGRYFRSKRLAKRYLSMKYGVDRVQRLPGRQKGRWAYLIKNLKEGANAS